MKIQFYEKDGVGRFKLNDTEIKNLIKYEINRKAETETTEITFTISVPNKNFETVENFME